MTQIYTLFLLGSSFIITSRVEVDRGFEGCISDIELGDYKSVILNLDKDVIEASNVKDCSTDEADVRACNSNPCQNQGSCENLNEDYLCTCPEGFG